MFLDAFVGADSASKATDRRSMSGGATLFGGACVCWFFQDAEMCQTFDV